MRVLVAPDSFKGSLSALRAAAAISTGLRRACAYVEIDLCPMADGGRGTVQVFMAARGGEEQFARVRDPLGREIRASWCLHRESKTAVLELASACGLGLLSPEERDPMNTTTYGLGELVGAALNAGTESIIVGLGDSATIDAGLGICQALGLKASGVEGYATGGQLRRVEALDRSELHQRIQHIDLIAACDVQNPLCGPSGAVRVFGEQKGASPENFPALEQGLEQIADLLNPEGALMPATGAAGGAAFGMQEILGARLVRGADLLLEVVGFDKRAAKSDLIITGEGRLDAQSLEGKTCIGVSRRARELGVPVIALVGSLAGDYALFAEEGLSGYYSLCDHAADITGAMKKAEHFLALTAETALREVMAKGS